MQTYNQIITQSDLKKFAWKWSGSRFMFEYSENFKLKFKSLVLRLFVNLNSITWLKDSIAILCIRCFSCEDKYLFQIIGLSI